MDFVHLYRTVYASNKPDNDTDCNQDDYVAPGKTDTFVQLAISLALGLSAFLAFCALRPRWKSLYAARKQHVAPPLGPPALPDSFLGWIPALFRISDQQVLSSAGLDAFVILAFFKMSIKLFLVMFFFALVVLEPINRHFISGKRLPPYGSPKAPPGSGRGNSSGLFPLLERRSNGTDGGGGDGGDGDDDNSFNRNMGYLWAYLVFVYFFTWLTLYYLDRETFRVIRVRQQYLGSQSTITDRTFRLSGIPQSLRTEAAIKDLVERLEIGKVDSVTLCRNWRDLDRLVAQREAVLHRLEKTWSEYLGQGQPPRLCHSIASPGEDDDVGDDNGEQGTAREIDPQPQPYSDLTDEEAGGENVRLLGSGGGRHTSDTRARPQTRLWYGFLNMQSRKTDGIDYYQEQLRRLDSHIVAARKRTFEAADLAFVTMDSTAACQMAIQALLDPNPGQLLTKPAPAPSDVVWPNTYASRVVRRLRSWVVTLFVLFFSVVWLIPVAFLATTLSLCTIRKFFPAFADSLQSHPILKALVQTGLPTATVSLLNIAVPYLYEFLSDHQGMLSRSDVALSVVSKNFFFTFFNIFLVFTVTSAGTEIFNVIRDSLKDTTYIAYALAGKIEELSVFYTNFIMLQGLGLFPFRLLEFGSVALWPLLRLGARTPRDFARMVEPPLFSCGFYLPTALFVFILCLVYSCLPGGWLVLFLGATYFALGHMTYKYQLLYAMDQPQHATGGAWRMIGYRVIFGLVVMQLTMSGYLALRSALTVSLLVVPPLMGTLVYSYGFRRRFEPLTRFIALRSIRRGWEADDVAAEEDDMDDLLDMGDEGGDDGEYYGGAAVIEADGVWRRRRGPRRAGWQRMRRSSTVDEDREKGLRFVNPSLVVPLEQPWIYQEPPPTPASNDENDEEGDGAGIGNERRGRYSNEPASFPDGRNSPFAGGSGAGGAGGRGEAGEAPPSPGASGRGGKKRSEDEDAAPPSQASSMSLGDTHVWRDGPST